MDEFWTSDDPLIRLWWLKRLSGGGGGEPVYKTVSGNPVTFDAVAAPLQQLRVDFSAVQSGWTGLTVTRCGKNLINISECVYGYWTANNGDVSSSPKGVISQHIKLRPNLDITMSASGIIPFSYSIVELDANGAFIKRTHMALNLVDSEPLTIRTQENTAEVYCQAYDGSDESATPEWVESLKWQLEIGSSMTEYELYTASSYPISWETEAGTVYNGYVDLVTGKLVVTDQSTPIHYQLTPQTIRTITGSNTISTAGDDVTVTYRES